MALLHSNKNLFTIYIFNKNKIAITGICTTKMDKSAEIVNVKFIGHTVVVNSAPKIQCHVVKNTLLQTALFGDFTHWVMKFCIFYARTRTHAILPSKHTVIVFNSICTSVCVVPTG